MIARVKWGLWGKHSKGDRAAGLLGLAFICGPAGLFAAQYVGGWWLAIPSLIVFSAPVLLPFLIIVGIVGAGLRKLWVTWLDY